MDRTSVIRIARTRATLATMIPVPAHVIDDVTLSARIHMHLTVARTDAAIGSVLRHAFEGQRDMDLLHARALSGR